MTVCVIRKPGDGTAGYHLPKRCLGCSSEGPTASVPIHVYTLVPECPSSPLPLPRPSPEVQVRTPGVLLRGCSVCAPVSRSVQTLPQRLIDKLLSGGRRVRSSSRCDHPSLCPHPLSLSPHHPQDQPKAAFCSPTHEPSGSELFLLLSLCSWLLLREALFWAAELWEETWGGRAGMQVDTTSPGTAADKPWPHSLPCKGNLPVPRHWRIPGLSTHVPASP